MAGPVDNGAGDRAQPALILGGILSLAGASTVLIGIAGTAGDLAGLAAVIAGTMIAAPFARTRGAVLAEWWNLMVTGALLALGGTALALGLESIGGLLAGGGSILVVVAAVFGPLSAAAGAKSASR